MEKIKPSHLQYADRRQPPNTFKCSVSREKEPWVVQDR